MKIILINLRYFISGGPERYMFNIKELLEANGHEVIPFSVEHDANLPTAYSKYFLQKIGKGTETYFSEYSKSNPKDIIKLFGRLFYSFEADRKLTRLIKDTKPDLVYVLYFENKISPSVITAAKRQHLPVVVRISDFGIICANNILYLKNKQQICEKCVHHSRLNLVMNKCYHGSYMYSALKYSSYKLHDLLGINRKIDAFVIPSQFTRRKFTEFGIPESRIRLIPTFFNSSYYPEHTEYGDYALYIGRVDPDKGIRTLVDAFIGTGYPLKIIGFSSTNYDQYIADYIKGKDHRIEMLGRMEFREIAGYLENCRFTVVSSEWYDNFPNAILESFAFRKAVIATEIGSLKELVEDGKTGLLFRYADAGDLRKKMIRLFENPVLAKELGENGYRKLQDEFSAERHLKSLLQLFESLI